MKKIFIIAYVMLFYLIVTISFSGCSPRIISSWDAAKIPEEAMNKVLVLGITKNSVLTSHLEKHMATELLNKGVQASTASYEFEPVQWGDFTEDEIVDKLQTGGFSSIMLFSFQPKSREQNYVRDASNTKSRYVGKNRFYRRYLSIGEKMNTDDFTDGQDFVLETEIYYLQTDNLIFSCRIKTKNPMKINNRYKAYAQSVVNQMKNKGII